MITDSMGFFKPSVTKVSFKHTQMCFKTYLNHPINQKTSREKKKLRAFTVLKKEGGGLAMYDHDHRFNGFFFKPSLIIHGNL